jgi:hypothetical protein
MLLVMLLRVSDDRALIVFRAALFGLNKQQPLRKRK